MNSYDDCIVFLLAKAYQKAHKTLKNRIKPYGLTPEQYLVINTVREEQGVSAGELGRKLVLDSATLSGILDRMADKGWIKKQTDADDRRVVRVYLGDKAKKLDDEAFDQRQIANEEVLTNLSLEEKVLLKRLLQDIRR